MRVFKFSVADVHFFNFKKRDINNLSISIFIMTIKVLSIGIFVNQICPFPHCFILSNYLSTIWYRVQCNVYIEQDCTVCFNGFQKDIYKNIIIGTFDEIKIPLTL